MDNNIYVHLNLLWFGPGTWLFPSHRSNSDYFLGCMWVRHAYNEYIERWISIYYINVDKIKPIRITILGQCCSVRRHLTLICYPRFSSLYCTDSIRVMVILDGTICPWSSDPFYIVTYCIKWVTTSWTYSIIKWLSCCSRYDNILLI